MAQEKRRRTRATPVDITPAEADRDILDQYFAEVSRYALLHVDEEQALARRIRRGDEHALDELVRRNLRFVVSVAKKYQNRGLPLIDLIGEGNVGLMTASGSNSLGRASTAGFRRQHRTMAVPVRLHAHRPQIPVPTIE